MTLDEAIKHAEEVAEEKENIIDKTYATLEEDRSLFEKEETECKKCAEEHRQLAEWMKDYKRLLKQEFCEDWYDVPSYEMTLEQAKQAVKDLRKKLAEHLAQRPCADAISRQAAIVALDNRMSSLDNVDMQIAMGFAKGIINDLPPVTPQPKTGKWITKCQGFPPEPTTMCSECGFDRDFYFRYKGWDKIKYCPHCGAKMEVEE